MKREIRSDGYVRVRVNGRRCLEHTLIAERAFGRPLPHGVVVHHVDENKTNNEPTNLVICTHAYHRLIHQRLEAMKASDDPTFMKCKFCKGYSPPEALRGRAHPECERINNRRRYQERKA